MVNISLYKGLKTCTRLQRIAGPLVCLLDLIDIYVVYYLLIDDCHRKFHNEMLDDSSHTNPKHLKKALNKKSFP